MSVRVAVRMVDGFSGHAADRDQRYRGAGWCRRLELIVYCSWSTGVCSTPLMIHGARQGGTAGSMLCYAYALFHASHAISASQSPDEQQACSRLATV